VIAAASAAIERHHHRRARIDDLCVCTVVQGDLRLHFLGKRAVNVRAGILVQSFRNYERKL